MLVFVKAFTNIFSALNEVHQFLPNGVAHCLTQSGLTSQLSKSNKHDESVLTF